MSVDIARHDEIKRLLRARRVTFLTIATEVGVSREYVTMVCQGHRSSHRIQQAIANKLGVTPESLWPQKYPDKEA
ncbi:DNA-binding protein [Ensifer sp. MPMI2T]|nr:DNA-binding protein [Ensifer sp. MPMI2T]